jgi:hypothetical protein
MEALPSRAEARGPHATFAARLNSLLKKSARCAKSSKTKIAGAEAYPQFADLIGPTEVVPLLQGLLDCVFQ